MVEKDRRLLPKPTLATFFGDHNSDKNYKNTGFEHTLQ